jgi:hypothetical protein
VGISRNLVIAVIIILALAAFFLFVPMRELSGRNAATIAYERVTQPNRPYVVQVKPPQEIIQWMAQTREWIIKQYREPEKNSASSDKSRRKREEDPPKDIYDKAIKYLDDDSVAPEIRLYIMWWLQHYTHFHAEETELAQFASPDFLKKLRDRDHCVLLARILDDNTYSFLYENSKLLPNETPYSKDLSAKICNGEIAALNRAAELAPDDAFSILLELEAAHLNNPPLDKVSDDFGYSVKDLERLSKVFYPYMEKLLSTKEGWLIGEPKWFAYLTGSDKENGTPYTLFSINTTAALWFTLDTVAEQAVKNKDWKRLCVLADVVKHLSSIKPDKRYVFKEEYIVFSVLADKAQDAVKSPSVKAEIKSLSDELNEFTKSNAQALSYKKTSDTTIDEKNREDALRQATKLLDENIERFKKSISELDAPKAGS